MKVLITGISGFLARMVAERLVARGHDVLGVDRRPWPDCPRAITMYQEDIRKRPVEDIFRTKKPDALVHMATVTHVTEGRAERYKINLHGTRALFDHCHTYGVKRAVFVGRHTTYGAAPDAALYRTEADPPLAVSTFPDLAATRSADLFAASAIWRYPETRTSVLRIVYTLGTTHRSTLANFVNGPRVAMVLGFDPLFHFMHELDAAEAITIALEKGLQGVFNVAGPPPVPLSILCRATGRVAVPVPEVLYPLFLGRFGFARLPRGAIAHVKYPIVVDDSSFLEATAFQHQFDEEQVMEAFRLLE